MTACPRDVRSLELGELIADQLADAASDRSDDESCDVVDDEPRAERPRTLVTGVGPTADADDFGEESFP